MPPWLRSVLSVLVGFVVFYALQGVCTFVAMRVMHRGFDAPTTGYLLANLLYTFIAAAMGGYVAARLAHRSPVAHAVGVAVLIALISLQSLSKGFGSQETWFVVTRAVGAPLFAILGGALDASRHRRLLA